MDVYRQLSARHGRTEFVGYDDLTNESTVLVLIDDGDVVQAAGEGQQVEVVLDRFPFYAESGGQVGDTGTLTTPDGAVLTVTDTRPGLEGFHIHTARVTTGEARTGRNPLRFYDREHALLREVAELLAVRPADTPQAPRKRLETLAGVQAELGALCQRELTETATRIAAGAEPVGAGWLATGTAEDATADELRALAADVLTRLPAGPGIAILAATRDGKALLAAAVTRDLLDTGTEARQILARAARAIGGGAGGKGTLANAGRRGTDHLTSALALAQADARGTRRPGVSPWSCSASTAESVELRLF
jgi:alanyl-tRNA synthetase